MYNNQSVFDNDLVFQQYCYLPAVFMNGASFVWPNNDQAIPSRNYGMSVMYAPGFFAAWAECLILDRDTKSGFSDRFASYIHWLGIFYTLAGLFILRRLLLRFFTEGVTAFVLFSGLFGSLLFYYTFSESEMPHAHLFFLFSVFLWLTVVWHKKPGISVSIGLAAVAGIISLINVFDLYIIFIFLFWDTTRFGSLRNKLAFLAQHKKNLFWALFVFVLFWVPQLWFNHQQTGRLFYDRSPKESYTFSDPGLWQVLLSYKQGWLPYSPVALLLLISLFWSRLPFFERRYFVSVFLLVWYVYSCSWDWHAGKGYGAATLCEAFAWLSFPYGHFVSACFNRSKQPFRSLVIKILLIGLVFSSALIVMGWTYKLNEGFFEPLKMDAQKYWTLIMTFKK